MTGKLRGVVVFDNSHSQCSDSFVILLYARSVTSYTFNYVFRDLIRALKFQITEVLETRNSNQAARPSQRGGGATVWARDYT